LCDLRYGCGCLDGESPGSSEGTFPDCTTFNSGRMLLTLMRARSKPSLRSCSRRRTSSTSWNSPIRWCRWWTGWPPITERAICLRSVPWRIVRLAHIEACPVYLESPTSRSQRKLFHVAWTVLDMDDRWELESGPCWQTDEHRIKSHCPRVLPDYFPTSSGVEVNARRQSRSAAVRNTQRSCTVSGHA